MEGKGAGRRFEKQKKLQLKWLKEDLKISLQLKKFEGDWKFRLQ